MIERFVHIVGHFEQLQIFCVNRPLDGQTPEQILERTPVRRPDQDNGKIGDLARLDQR